MHSHGKNKIQNYGSFILKHHEQNDHNYVVNQEKKIDCVKITILWICEGTMQFG